MSFDNIRLEKGMYGCDRTFTQTLEELDPSENYKGTNLEGLDAFQRQLKRFDIKVAGSDSSVVGKFFQTSDSAVLFPEYVTRVIRSVRFGQASEKAFSFPKYSIRWATDSFLFRKEARLFPLRMKLSDSSALTL